MTDLSRFAALAEFGESACKQLGEVLEAREFAAGRTLFRAGEEAAEMIFLMQGEVTIKVGGRERGRLSSGDVLAAGSLVLIGKHECTAEAHGPVSVRVLSRESYLRLRADHPQVALDLQEGILRGLSGALRSYLEESDSQG